VRLHPILRGRNLWYVVKSGTGLRLLPSTVIDMGMQERQSVREKKIKQLKEKKK
jgi:hypothetical protein